MEQGQPGDQQNEEQAFVRKSLPAVDELNAKVFENSVGRLLFHSRRVWNLHVRVNESAASGHAAYGMFVGRVSSRGDP